MREALLVFVISLTTFLWGAFVANTLVAVLP